MNFRWVFEAGVLKAFAENGKEVAAWAAPEQIGIGLADLFNCNALLSKCVLRPFAVQQPPRGEGQY